MKITGKAQILIYIFLFKMSLRADSRLRGQLDFGCMKRCVFGRAKRAENFPHNPTCFPHNQHFLPHNVPENFRIICYFFPHPIRCPASGKDHDNVTSDFLNCSNFEPVLVFLSGYYSLTLKEFVAHFAFPAY